jgi:hypothetical protein
MLRPYVAGVVGRRICDNRRPPTIGGWLFAAGGNCKTEIIEGNETNQEDASYDGHREPVVLPPACFPHFLLRKKLFFSVDGKPRPAEGQRGTGRKGEEQPMDHGVALTGSRSRKIQSDERRDYSHVPAAVSTKTEIFRRHDA